MDSDYRQPIEWWDDVPLAAFESRIIEIGFAGSGRTVAHVTSHCFLTWGIISERIVQWNVHGDGQVAFTTPDLMFVQVIAATVYSTPYNLGAPYNKWGFVVLTRPFIRLRIDDTAYNNHAYTRIYAKVW